MAHCAEGFMPSPPAPKTITLKYFPIAGRAEPIRLALMLGNVKYFDQRIPGQDWTEKWKASTPYGQVPTLNVDGKTIAQSKAILRYVGKLCKYHGYSLYPKDPLVAAKVDELMDAFDDLWILLAPTFLMTDPREKESYRQNLFAPGGAGSAKVSIFERTLAEGGTGYVVPQAGLSVADLLYFCFFNVLRSGFVEGLPRDLLKDYPQLMKHKERIANLSEVKAYYTDSKRSNPNGVPYYEVFLPGK
eukprot:CAMPEP_0206575492 /NCGR_PEP_ID=MMETSP0325_2-20121206/30113_1 /ASSEMBLY_ACC=CAM_ASM_000347 /TAXON_ID=2866 /ORGANISM="Crypthecodinium cohnii, Strain Seligo" /LENGTH=244 /DNA_ID=CAMNT_0054080377 /DNA_START=14 /DNA_END=748 /DNA_ORIENTATION=+